MHRCVDELPNRRKTEREINKPEGSPEKQMAGEDEEEEEAYRAKSLRLLDSIPKRPP